MYRRTRDDYNTRDKLRAEELHQKTEMYLSYQNMFSPKPQTSPLEEVSNIGMRSEGIPLIATDSSSTRLRTVRISNPNRISSPEWIPSPE
jgi:hypothetical protein